MVARKEEGAVRHLGLKGMAAAVAGIILRSSLCIQQISGGAAASYLLSFLPPTSHGGGVRPHPLSTDLIGTTLRQAVSQSVAK